MGSIQSAIELQDNFTGVLMNVISAVNRSVPAMEQMHSVMNESVDMTSIQVIQEQLDQAALAANELGTAMHGIGAPTVNPPVFQAPEIKQPQLEVPDGLRVPVTPYVTEQPQIEVPDEINVPVIVEDITQNGREIEELKNRLNSIAQMQDAINAVGHTLYVLPDGSERDISNVNHEIERMEQALEFLQSNPFMLDTSVTELQIQAMTKSLDDLAEKQQELNHSLGNAPAWSFPEEMSETVRVHVEWKTDNLDVFTGTGVERFQQEVQSANNMLEQLSSTQDAIARRAFDTNVLSPQAFRDLNSMAVRIDAIRGRIQQIEVHPVNLGTDMANAGLEQLRGELEQAVQQQEELNRAVENMDVQAANEAYLQLSQTVGNTERYIRDNVDEQGRFNRKIEQGTGEANQLMDTIRGAIAAYATIQSVSAALGLSDQMTFTTARLDLMNDGLQTTQDLQNMIYLSAQRARGAYQATADAVSKLGLMAGDAFGSSEEIIAFMEQVNKQFTIAGTEAAGIDAAMLQLTQAMSSGVLRGEEYNSILEQAPNIIQNIARYIEENEEVLGAVASAMKMETEELAGNVQGHLKDIAGDGILSSELVKNAMFYAAEETNAKFEQMPQTFSQVWTSFQNTALTAFQPVLQEINEIANNETFQEFMNRAAESVSMVACIALEAFELLAAGAGTVADNWSWLEPIILGVAAALGVYYGAMLLYNAVTAASAGVTAAKAFAEKVHAASLAMESGATFAATAAQYGFNAALLACPLTWVIMLIIGLIALLYAAVAAMNHFTGESISATGILCGAAAAAGAFLLNTAIAVINAILQVLWTAAEPFISIIEWVLNAANGGFDSFGGAVINLIGNIISWFLSLGKVITRIIDAIFGSDWTSGLTSLQEEVLAWGKGEDAINLNRNAPAINYRLNYADAWDKGYSFGQGIDEKIAEFDIASLFDVNIPSLDDYADLSNYGAGLAVDIGDIAGNTGAIKDSMDITAEELKYLRDIAEQESINRFTTAEITIEQTNHNQISGTMDLDGVMDGLTDAVYEAADRITEGVHE